mmetsp:Transcript_110531/g.276789  ORF Transcript_110531/g.276789 Transcript_110531/m.276789 type:complete len:222 (-) Transcript_110531:1077-1742(-)
MRWHVRSPEKHRYEGHTITNTAWDSWVLSITTKLRTKCSSPRPSIIGSTGGGSIAADTLSALSILTVQSGQLRIPPVRGGSAIVGFSLRHGRVCSVHVLRGVAFVGLPEMVDIESAPVVEEGRYCHDGDQYLESQREEEPRDAKQEESLVPRHEDNLGVGSQGLREFFLEPQGHGKVLVEGVALLPVNPVPGKDEDDRGIHRSPGQVPNVGVLQTPKPTHL